MSQFVPYVELQDKIISLLFRLKDSNPGFLLDLHSIANDDNHESGRCWRFLDDNGLMFDHRSMANHEMPRACIEIVRGQLYIDEGKIYVRNLLGFPLHDNGVSDFKKYANRGGGHPSNIRTDRFSHPSVLEVGDIIGTGCRLLSPPREGGNGAVLLHLTGGTNGHWISVPARIPIALISAEDLAYLEEMKSKQQ